MDLMQTLRERAAARPMRVAFPEGDNETMMRAVRELADEGLAQCVLVRALPGPPRLPLQAQGRGQAHDAPPGARPHHAGARRR